MNSTTAYVPKKPRRIQRHEIRGIDYCINEWGDENMPLLIYLHGWGDTGSTFQFVVDSFAHDWHVVAPDWRGFGRSAHVGRSYWFPDYLADLDALVDIYSPDTPVRLVGHSMGANIGGLYAGAMPERVLRFVNVEGFGLIDGDPLKAPDNYRRWIKLGKSPAGYRSYSSVDELVPRVQKRGPRMTLERAVFAATEWSQVDSDGVVHLRADPAHKMPNAVQYRRAEAMACWNNVEASVLLVMGAETDFTSAMQTWIDPDLSNHPFHGAPTASIEGAGHMVHFEAPEALAAVVEAFFLDGDT